MSELAAWQLVAIAAGAIVFIGGMQVAVWRLFARRSAVAPATARPGEPIEAMLYGASAPDGASVFDGFSYRVSARFAGRCRIVVGGGRLTFCGPRGPRGLYLFWIWLQATLMGAAGAAAVWALVALDWRMLVWSVGLLIASTLVMAIGAGVWPGLGEVSGLNDGRMPALELGLADVNGVKVGPGWADGGLAVILAPYVGGIDRLAVGHAVSWWGPDETGREVRYAFHCYDPADAERLSGLLIEAAR